MGTAALVGLRIPTEARYQSDVAEVMSVAPLVPRGSTLVALRLWRDSPYGSDARNRARDPLSHQAGRIAVLRGALDVGDFEAETPYFPLRFRAGTDPRRMIDRDLQGLELVPPRVDLTRGPQIVLLIGRTRATAGTFTRPESVRLLSQLTTSYRLIATSRRSHLVEVWLRLRAAGSTPPSGPAVHEQWAHPPRSPWPAGDAGLATAASPVRAAADDELDKRDGAKQLSPEVPLTGQAEDSAIDSRELAHGATGAPVLRERVGKRR